MASGKMSDFDRIQVSLNQVFYQVELINEKLDRLLTLADTGVNSVQEWSDTLRAVKRLKMAENDMSTWNISSRDGHFYGKYQGGTPACALLTLHRQAGYNESQVWIDSKGQLCFRDQDTKNLLGGLDEWSVTAI